MDKLTVGRAAKLAGVNVETLRYYERRGLMPEPERSVSNYRLYTEESVRRLKFIKHAQEIGFTLSEIQELLSLRATPDARCAEVRARTEEKIRDIDEKLRMLNSMRNVLQKLVADCSGRGGIDKCPILAALEENDDAD